MGTKLLTFIIFTGLSAAVLSGCSFSAQLGESTATSAELTKNMGDALQKTAGQNFSADDVFICPTDLPIAVGSTEICTLTLASGISSSYNLVMTSVDGSNYEYTFDPIAGDKTITAAGLTKLAGEELQYQLGTEFAEGDVFNCPTELTLAVGETEICSLVYANGETDTLFNLEITSVENGDFNFTIEDVNAS